MTRLARLRRFGWIVLGYVAAWWAGVAAVWCKNRGISEADQLASSGMFAFGDAITFLFAAALVAIAPTLLLFRSIPLSPRVLQAYTTTSLLLASNGLFCAVLWLVPFGQHNPLLQTLRSLSLLRVLSAPLFLLVVAPGIMQAATTNRRRALRACAFEICTMGLFGVWILLHR